MSAAPLSLGELIEHWTLREDEAGLVAVKHGDSRLGFALLLRFYGRYGRFPRNRGELHPDAVEFVARAVGADPAELAGYDWAGRTIERHRREIRDHFGFRVCGKEDGAKLAEFLADGVAQRERRYALIREEFLAECRVRRVQGKEGLLFRVADAALARPDDPVRAVVFPVVGEDNLRHLVAEYKSYTHHYRAGLIRLLEVLESTPAARTGRCWMRWRWSAATPPRPP